MRLKKKSFTKLAMVGGFALVVLSLAACNDTIDNQDLPTESMEAEQRTGSSSNESAQNDLSVFDDFPEWWRDSFTEEEKQIFLDAWTPEDLAQARKEAEEWGESGPPVREGAQQVIVGPDEGTGGGAWRMTEDGLVEIDADEIDSYLETEVRD